ncbi:MAG TPA: DUF4249 domain-containing protein [Puia sp.]|nr:DUF4249 domain-containing protein [Puia sp.]
MKKSILTLAALSVIAACQKTVTLPLNTAASQLVIQGEVTDAPGPYTVTINQSVGFYADNTFPAVSGAAVKISDGQTTDSLTETAPGVYLTHSLQGRSGTTYTLRVQLHDSVYTATSTMPAPVTLDSVTFDNNSRFKKNQVTPQSNFQDPPGVKNYYQYVLYINGARFTKDIYAFEDRLTDGKYITQNLHMDSSYLNVGDQLRVDMYCVDVNVYNYFNQLAQSSGTGAFNTAAAPADPSSNISNGAYGIFSAHTISSKTLTVD